MPGQPPTRLIALGRYDEAFESASRGWEPERQHRPGRDRGHRSRRGGRSAGPDPRRACGAAPGWHEGVPGQAITQAVGQVPPCQHSTVGGTTRRSLYLAAARELDEFGARTRPGAAAARCRSRGRRPVRRGRRSGRRRRESFFAERGAQAYVDTYQQHAFHPPDRPAGQTTHESAATQVSQER